MRHDGWIVLFRANWKITKLDWNSIPISNSQNFQLANWNIKIPVFRVKIRTNFNFKIVIYSNFQF